ncbi:MAG TPA: hypothetical protein VHF01_16190 [Candidatus Acidoferrum sp.]|nr:hypothetical protein [Candidatus Acidoferrum sp.]
MRRISRNYWRLGWVLLVNSAVVVLQLTGPIRAHHDQQLLHQVMRTAPPIFSYWKELFSDPWVPVLAVILLAGIVTEVRRNALSPVINLAPFTFWLVLAFRDPFYSKQLLILFSLVMVIVVDLVFYAFAFRRRQAEGGDAGLPSRV